MAAKKNVTDKSSDELLRINQAGKKPGTRKKDEKQTLTPAPRARGEKSKVRQPKRPENLPVPAPKPPAGIELVQMAPVRKPGRPVVWTPELVHQVALDMSAYVASVDFPTIAEFCYTRGISPRRISEHQELVDAREMLQAKLQAMTINRGLKLGPGEGALGSFLLRMSANAGAFSLTEKQEVEVKARPDESKLEAAFRVVAPEPLDDGTDDEDDGRQ